jgi:hypothetical protein
MWKRGEESLSFLFPLHLFPFTQTQTHTTIKKETTSINASTSHGNIKHACITFGETVGKKF